MHGKVIAVFVTAGAEVAKGEPLFIVEAMKMEHSVASPRAGRVASIAADVGDQVQQGAAVVVLEEEEVAAA